MLFKSVISLALLAASALADIKITSPPSTVEAGKPYTITWESSDLTTPVTLILRKGASTNLGTVQTITDNGVGGSYSWTPDTTLTDGTDYAFEIVQGAQNNYLGPFPLTGGTGTSAVLVSSATGSASVSASASASASTTSGAASSSASSASESASSAAASSSESAAATTSATSASASTSARATNIPANSASGLQSPVAFILCAVAAMLYLN